MYDVAPCGARPEPFGPADIVILPLRVGQVCVLAQGERMLLVGCGRRIEETLWGGVWIRSRPMLPSRLPLTQQKHFLCVNRIGEALEHAKLHENISRGP